MRGLPAYCWTALLTVFASCGETGVAISIDSIERDDGTRYYSKVTVNFRALNMFGVVVSSVAEIGLREGPDDSVSWAGAGIR